VLYGQGARFAHLMRVRLILVMRKKLTLLIAVLIAAAGFFLYGTRVAWLYAVHDDACRAIAMEIAARTADNGALPDHEVQSLIGDLISASVIHGRVDADGAPRDLNGSPFIIQREPNHVSVATERSVWQPFRIKHVAEVESHNKAMQPGAVSPRR